MRDLPSGVYNYYPPLSPTTPIVVQVDRDIVWFAGDDQYRMLAKCSGRFVRLVEVAREPAVSMGEAAAKVVSSIGIAMLKRTLDEGGTISIPSLGITIGPEPDAAIAKALWIERARQIDPGDEMPPLMLLALLGQPPATPIATDAGKEKPHF